MHIRVLYRKILYVFLSLTIVFTSTTAAYAAAVSTWTVKDAIMNGATATITAIQNKGGTALKSVIAHKPKAAAIGKDLVKGGGALAIAFAMSEIVGLGVDWVLDPANNAITYTDDKTGGGSGSGAVNYAPDGKGYIISGLEEQHGYFASDMAAASFLCVNYNPYGQHQVLSISGGSVTCTSNGETGEYTGRVRIVDLPDGVTDDDVKGDDGKKSISLDTVAAKILDNAEAGHADSQEYVKSIAVGVAASGELDAGFDAAAEPDTGADTGTGEGSGDTPFDPSGIINAINAIKAMIAGLIASVSGIADWLESPPEEEDASANKVLVDETPLTGWQDKANAGYVSFGGQCPNDVQIPMNYMGATTNLAISYIPFCQFASLIKPAVIFGAWISAMLIISGGRSRE